MIPPIMGSGTRTTPSLQVIPFYLYAALGFLAATLMLLFHVEDLQGHYFQPKILAITHSMALAWGTMMLFGASHQLLPVLMESSPDSPWLAYICFLSAALGIPMLVYGFYQFHLGWIAITGAILVNLAALFYWVNVWARAWESPKVNIHGWYMISASTWLLSTTLFGLLLLVNLRFSLIPYSSLDYLSLHAHMGIGGWFALMVVGVGSRLVPLFLLSKYNHPPRLWLIFILIHATLLMIAAITLFAWEAGTYTIPLLLALIALVLFMDYLYRSYKQRIRKKIDWPLRASLGAFILAWIPIAVLLLSLLPTHAPHSSSLYMIYGYSGFFGWISAIMLGMSFKTLPFIVWTRRYAPHQGKGKIPMPKDLWNLPLLRLLYLTYIIGFALCLSGQLLPHPPSTLWGAAILTMTAVLYTWMIFYIVFHPQKNPKTSWK